jgi:hypothetical protein
LPSHPAARIQSPLVDAGHAELRHRAGSGLVQQTFIRRARRTQCVDW